MLCVPGVALCCVVLRVELFCCVVLCCAVLCFAMSFVVLAASCGVV